MEKKSNKVEKKVNNKVKTNTNIKAKKVKKEEDNKKMEKKDINIKENDILEKNEETKAVVEEKEDKVIKELKADDNKCETELQNYREKFVRKIAEFENYKKRTSEEYVRLISSANESLILKLLPVMDDIERMENNYKPEIKLEDFKKGTDMIFNKFKGIIDGLGLKEIEAVGNEFDPNFHEALMMVENDKVDSNKIIDQHEKGYIYNEKVIRHSKVLVAK